MDIPLDPELEARLANYCAPRLLDPTDFTAAALVLCLDAAERLRCRRPTCLHENSLHGGDDRMCHVCDCAQYLG